MLGRTSMIRAALALLLMSPFSIAGAEILNADTLQKGTYRSACFTVG